MVSSVKIHSNRAFSRKSWSTHQWGLYRRRCSANPRCQACSLCYRPQGGHQVEGILEQAWCQEPHWNWLVHLPLKSQRARFVPRWAWVLWNQVQREPPLFHRALSNIEDSVPHCFVKTKTNITVLIGAMVFSALGLLSEATYEQLVDLSYSPVQSVYAQVQGLTLGTGYLGARREVGTGGGLGTSAHGLTAPVLRAEAVGTVGWGLRKHNGLGDEWARFCQDFCWWFCRIICRIEGDFFTRFKIVKTYIYNTTLGFFLQVFCREYWIQRKFWEERKKNLDYYDCQDYFHSKVEVLWRVTI